MLLWAAHTAATAWLYAQSSQSSPTPRLGWLGRALVYTAPLACGATLLGLRVLPALAPRLVFLPLALVSVVCACYVCACAVWLARVLARSAT